jgi:ABC-type transporter Mla subunit MlaD
VDVTHRAGSLPRHLPVQTANSLVKARTTLGTLGDQLVTLASVLDSADPPLDSVVTATRDTNTAAAQAQPPVDHIAATLDRANANARDLGPKLDESLTRARTIESKLRVLLLLPIGTR